VTSHAVQSAHRKHGSEGLDGHTCRATVIALAGGHAAHTTEAGFATVLKEGEQTSCTDGNEDPANHNPINCKAKATTDLQDHVEIDGRSVGL
jgi:hypothetical protein